VTPLARWLAGGAGVVVAPGMPARLAAAIDALLEDRAAAAEIGVRARARLSRFAAEPLVAARLCSLVDALMAGRTPVPSPAFDEPMTN
jgi:hypothetical protein